MLIPFHSPDASDSTWVRPLLQSEGLALCDYSFPVLFCWKDAYGFQYAPLGKRLLVRLTSSLGHSYLWPAGEGDPTPALDALTQDARAEGQPLRLIALTLYHKNWLEDHYPGRFCFEQARDGFDYLYSVDRLADLPGKKLHAKRNHIHRFDEQFPDWLFEPIGPDNLAECVEMEAKWYAEQVEAGRADANLGHERDAVNTALSHMEELGISGGLIRAGGQVVAFSLGSLTTADCYNVHFEKAYGEIQGAYAVINREMARWVRSTFPQVAYLNREDDMGLEGLRKAKLSYYPDILLKKYSAREV